MKQIRPLMIFLASALAGVFYVSAVSAQSPPPAAGQPAAASAQQPMPYRIVVVDIFALVNRHPRTVAKNEELKVRERSIMEAMQKRGEALQAKFNQLQQMKVDTADYTRLSEECIREKLDLERDLKVQQRSLVGDGTKSILDIYKEIREMIQGFAVQNNIAVVLVMQKMGQEAEESVLQGINQPELIVGQPIAWHYEKLDITELLIKQIAARYPNMQIGPASPASNTSAPMNSGRPNTNPIR